MKYVQDGGNVIVQYNTAMRNQPPIGPYPFSISRDRVTDEYAEVRILAPDHPVLNIPNKITSKDFEGWVQEEDFISQTNGTAIIQQYYLLTIREKHPKMVAY